MIDISKNCFITLTKTQLIIYTSLPEYKSNEVFWCSDPDKPVYIHEKYEIPYSDGKSLLEPFKFELELNPRSIAINDLVLSCCYNNIPLLFRFSSGTYFAKSNDDILKLRLMS